MSTESTTPKALEKRKQPEAEVAEPSSAVEPKQKKQKKAKQPEVEGESEGAKLTKEEKKARKAAKKTKTAESKPEEPQTEPTASTSDVKRDEGVKPAEEASKEEATPAEAPLEPKKKKARKRNKNNREQDSDVKVGNGTPEEDASLTEQAQKGIQYAWLYKHRHPKSIGEGDAKDDGTYWKFNKARQNWLWKNVWNEELIPQTYTGLVIEYLSSMQGQARQKLLGEAQKIVDTPIAEPAAEEADAATAEKADAEPSTETAEEATGNATEEVEAPKTVSPEKHRRAKLVVDALTSS